jgi:hypothetical protein
VTTRSPSADPGSPITLGELEHWSAVQRVVSIILLGAAVASALAAAFGWMSRGVGYALGVVFAVAGLFVRFGRETLADRTPKQALWMSSAVVGVAVIVGGLYWYFRPQPSNVVVLDGDLNIAVLPFEVEGTAADDDFGTTFADGVADALGARTGTALEGTGIRHDVRAMDVPLDLSQPPDDLAVRGEAIAAEAKADFVLTGLITSDELGPVIRPQLFVAPDRVPDAPELAGWYAGGEDVPADVDLGTNLQSQGRAYQDLRDAMGTLVDVGLALEDLSAGRAEGAAERLDGVIMGGDFHLVPRELALLVLGNALGREACPAGHCDEAQLERAGEAFRQAAEGAGGLARGRVGLGELALQRGQGAGCRPSEIDIAELDRAASLFQEVVDDGSAPPLARSKAMLGLARVDACRAGAGVDSAGGSVHGIAEALVAAADAGRSGVEHLAAEARSYEAVVAAAQQRGAEAVRALDDAIVRSKDIERTADWKELRAQLLAQSATCDLRGAITSLEEAIAIRQRLIATADGLLRTTLEADKADAEAQLTELRSRSDCG